MTNHLRDLLQSIRYCIYLFIIRDFITVQKMIIRGVQPFLTSSICQLIQSFIRRQVFLWDLNRRLIVDPIYIIEQKLVQGFRSDLNTLLVVFSAVNKQLLGLIVAVYICLRSLYVLCSGVFSSSHVGNMRAWFFVASNIRPKHLFPNIWTMGRSVYNFMYFRSIWTKYYIKAQMRQLCSRFASYDINTCVQRARVTYDITPLCAKIKNKIKNITSSFCFWSGPRISEQDRRTLAHLVIVATNLERDINNCSDDTDDSNPVHLARYKLAAVNQRITMIQKGQTFEDWIQYLTTQRNNQLDLYVSSVNFRYTRDVLFYFESSLLSAYASRGQIPLFDCGFDLDNIGLAYEVLLVAKKRCDTYCAVFVRQSTTHDAIIYNLRPRIVFILERLNNHLIFSDLEPHSSRHHRNKQLLDDQKDLDCHDGVRNKRQAKLDAKQRQAELTYARKVKAQKKDASEAKAQVPPPQSKEGEFLFSSTYKDKPTPPYLTHFQVKDVESIFGSIVKSTKKFENQTQSADYGELIRKIKFLEGKEKEESYVPDARDIIFQAYGEVQEVVLKPSYAYPLPRRVTFEPHDFVKFGEFDPKHFASQIASKKRKSQPPLLALSDNPNFLFEYFDSSYAQCHTMSIAKAKAMMTSMIRQEYTVDEIIEVIRHKTFVWKKKQPLSNKLSWITGYLPSEVYYYQISNRERFEEVLQDMICNLQSLLIQFCRNYCSNSELSRKELKAKYAARAKSFANLMRQPAQQLLFARGYSKEFVTRHVHSTFYNQLERDMTKSDVVSLHSHARRKISTVQKQQARDDKFLACDNYEYPIEPHSNFHEVLPLSCWLVLVLILLWERIWKMYMWIRSCFTQAVTVTNEIDKWTQFMENPFSILNDVNYQPLLVEVKSILHAAVHFYQGNRSEAFCWLSNIAVTRPGSVVSFFSKVWIEKPRTTINVDGQEYHLTPDEAERYTHWMAAGLNSSDFVTGLVQTHSNPLTDIVSAILPFFIDTGFTHITDNDIRSANSRYTYLSNLKRDMDSKMNAVYNVISIGCRTMFSYDPFDPTFSTHMAHIVEIMTFTNEINLDLDLNNRTELRKIITYYKHGLELQQSKTMLSVPSYMQSHFSKKMSVLETHARMATARLGIGSNREEPTCVLLTGPPGVGKSALITLMQEAISYLEGKPYEPQQSYTYTANTDFWEGYKNQRFVVMDDMFKEEDMDVRMKQATDIISMVNVAPMQLNMAFADKGMNFFNSDYIFCTTNLANHGFNNCTWQVGITDRDAIKRRFHLVFHREDPIGDPHIHDSFRLDKCDLFPDEVGRTFTALEIPKFIIRYRRERARLRESYVITQDKLREWYADDVQPHSFENITLDPIKLFRMVLEILKDIPAMINPRTRNLFIAMFFICILIAKAGPVYNYFFGPVAHSHDHKQKSGKGPKHRIEIRRRPKHGADIDEDPPHKNHVVAHSQNLDMAINNNISKCIICLYGQGCLDGKQIGSNAVGFHIRDGFVCTPAHFYLEFEEADDCTMTLTWNNNEITIPWPILYVRLDSEDLIVFKLPQMDRPPEMYKYLLPIDDFYELEEGESLKFVSYAYESGPKILTVNKAPVQPRVSYSVCGQTMLVISPLGYSCEAGRGDSGAMVFSESCQGSPRLVAMHLAGVRSRDYTLGISIVIWRELFDTMIGSVSMNLALPFPHAVCAEVKSDMAHIPPTKSQFHRTALHQIFPQPIEKKPAHLCAFENDDGDIIVPLYKAMSKLHQIPSICSPLPPSTLDYLMKLYPRKRETRILNYDEALYGCDLQGYLPVNYGTSPGYPYSLQKTKGKFPFIFRSHDDSLQYQPEFRSTVEQLHSELLAGRQIEVLWADILKDETRPNAKVDLGKTRLFSTCPLHYLVLVRMYFLDFVLYVQSLASTHPVSVGINPASQDWLLLFKRLETKAKSIVSGDYENYDGALPTILGEKFVEFVNTWYDDGSTNANVRCLLMHHVFRAKHICYSKIYQVADGNPSGNPITSIYNSFCNIMMLYTVLTQDLRVREKDFELAVYGDDNLVAVDLPGITSAQLAPYIKRRFNMVYTHFSKEDSQSHDTLFTIRYLGRSFVAREGLMRAPLEMAVVREIVYWRKGATSEDVVLISSVDSMFRELSHFPKGDFQALTQYFLREASKLVPHLIPFFEKSLLTYEGYINEMYFAEEERRPCDDAALWETHSHYSIRADTAGTNNQTTTTRNLQFTERASNDLNVTQVTQLGDLQDAAPIKSSAINDQILQEAYQQNNMEVFDMNKSLERLYTIDTLTWTTTEGPGSTIAVYDFPNRLDSQPYLAALKENFLWFRGGFRVAIRCTASKFNYGRLMVVYTPSFYDAYPRSNDLFTASGFPHIIVSASQSEAAILDIPFISTDRFIPAKGAYGNQLGTIKIMVLNPLVNITGVSDAVQLVIQAQYMDAELVLPRDALHSNPSIRKESVRKSRAGILTSNLEENSTEGIGLDIPKFAKPYADFFRTIARPLGTALQVATLLGLNKPTTSETTKPMLLDITSGFTQGKGLDMSKKFAMDPEAGILTRPLVGGIDQDEMSLEYVMGTPMLTYSFALTESSPVTILGSTNPYAVAFQYTYVDFVTRNFHFCSGSYKFKVYVTASVMHAVRLLIFLAKDPASDPETCYNRTIDVQGDTEIDFTIPYCNETFSRDIDTEAVFYNVYVKVLTWSQPTPGVTTPIYLNVYKAGASDFRVGCMKEMIFTPHSNPRKDFARPFAPIHHSMMGYVPNGIVYPEEYTSIRDIVHRMQPYSDFIESTPFPAYEANASPRMGLELWGTIFMFYRGSVRAQIFQRTDILGNMKVCGTFVTRSDTTDFLPGIDLGYSARPTMLIEIPWYFNEAFNSTTLQNTGLPGARYSWIVSVSSDVDGKFYSKAAGDDFSYMFLCPPPFGTLDPMPPTKGYSSLKSFLS